MKKNFSNLPLKLLSVILVMALVLTLFTGLSVSAVEVPTWDGSVAESYESGSGTAEDPFIIKNAAQLCKMVKSGGKENGVAAFYKVADDVKAIYFNDTTDMSVQDLKAAYTSFTTGWPTNVAFEGCFDGNGCTIYGFYAAITSAANFGFFPQIKEGATVKNLTFKNAVVDSGTNLARVGVLSCIGTKSDAADDTITVQNVSVVDSYIVNGEVYDMDDGLYNAVDIVRLKKYIALSKKYIESYADYNKDGEVNSMDLTAVRKHIIGDETLEIGELSNDCITTNDVYAAAMIGNVAGTSVLFENCYVNNNEFAIPVNKLDAAGFTVDSYGTSKVIKNSLSIGAVPVSSSNAKRFTYEDVVSDYAPSDYSGYKNTNYASLKVIDENTNLTGYNAKKVLAFDFENNWDFVVDGTPVPLLYNAETTANNPVVWDGTAANYDGGTGTESDPLIISNAAQLYKMISEQGKYNGAASYFKVANGVDALYINDTRGMTLEEAKTIKSDFATNWPVNKTFVGKFDGNGSTIYGLCTEAPDNGNGDLALGFANQLGNGAEIKNVAFKNAIVIGNGVQKRIAIIAAQTVSGAHDIALKNVSVTDSYMAGTKTLMSAMVGYVRAVADQTALTIENCLTADISSDRAAYLVGGFVADTDVTTNSDSTTSATVVMDNCLSVGSFPVESTYVAKIPAFSFNDIYTDAAPRYNGGQYNGYINSVTSDAIIGENALRNLNFDFENNWKVIENSYPVPMLYNSATTDNMAEYVWNGTVATAFESGTGTEEDPYIIKTGSQLYKMVCDGGKTVAEDGTVTPHYYKMANDIYLNNVTSASEFESGTWNNWIHSDWSSSAAIPVFAGHLDGGNNTVYGLYAKHTVRFGDNNAALIPNVADGASIKNLSVTDSYIWAGVGHIAGIVGGAPVKAFVTIDSCSVTNSIISGTENNKNWGAGGIVGGGLALPFMNNCYTYGLTIDGNEANGCVGGLLGTSNAFGNIKITNCYSAGYYPAGSYNNAYSKVSDGNMVNYANTYTDCSADAAGNTATVFTVLTTEQMQGADALSNMIFDHNELWQVTSSYPVFAVPSVASVRAYTLGLSDDYSDVNGDDVCDIADAVSLMNNYLGE